jgi:lipopolysaccharide transport system permease protein
MQISYNNSNYKKEFYITLLFHIFIDCIKGHELGWRFFIRDLKASYKKTFLGIIWLFFPALANGMIWIFLHSQRVVHFPDIPMNYAVFVLSGTMLWSLFAESVTLPISRYQKIMPTMSKLNFPRESVIIAAAYNIIFSICLKLLILIPLVSFFGHFPGFNTIFIFAIFLAAGLMGLAIGLFLSPVGLLYSDIGKGLPILLPFLMYLTPVVYPFHNEGIFMQLQRFNPVVPYLEALRSTIGQYEFLLLPEFLLFVSGSIILGAFSLIILRICFPFIIERSGS